MGKTLSDRNEPNVIIITRSLFYYVACCCHLYTRYQVYAIYCYYYYNCRYICLTCSSFYYYRVIVRVAFTYWYYFTYIPFFLLCICPPAKYRTAVYMFQSDFNRIFCKIAVLIVQLGINSPLLWSHCDHSDD